MGCPHSTVQTPGLHPGLPSETRSLPGALFPGTRPPSSETASLGLPSPLGETGMIPGGKSVLKLVHVVLYTSILFPIRGTSHSNVGSSAGKHRTPPSLLAAPACTATPPPFLGCPSRLRTSQWPRVTWCHSRGPPMPPPPPLWLHRPERPSLTPGVCSQRSSFSLRLFPTPGVPAPTPMREWPAQESACSLGAPVGWSRPWAGREAAGGQRPPFLCLSSCVCNSQKGVWLRSLSPSVCSGSASCRDRHRAEDAAASQGRPPRCLL